jgi:protease I
MTSEASPLVLAVAGVLGGRKTAAYPALAPDVAQAGAEFVDSDAVVDGVVVSARAWPDHPGWMRELLRILRDHAPPPRSRRTAVLDNQAGSV